MTTSSADGPPEAVEVRPRLMDEGVHAFARAAYAQPFRWGARMLLAFLVFVVPVTLLGLLGALYLIDADALLVNDRVRYFSLPDHALAVAIAVPALAVLAVLLGQVVAGVVAMGGIAGRSPTLRWALHAALRRGPAALLFGILQVVALAPFVFALSGFFLHPFGLSDEWLALVFVLGSVLGVAVFAFVGLAWPVALTEGGGPWRALRRSVRLAHGYRAWTAGTVLGSGFLLPGLLLLAAYQLLVRASDALSLSPHPVWHWVLIGALTVVGAAVFTSVQVAALLYDRPLGLPEGEGPAALAGERAHLDAGALDALLPAHRTRSGWPRLILRAGTGAVLVVLGLLLPGLLGVGLLAVNPTGLPRMTRATVYEKASNLRVEAIPMPNGSAVAWSTYDRGVPLDRCVAGSCSHVTDGEFPLNDDAAVARDGDGLVLAGYRQAEPETTAEKAWEIVLAHCDGHRCAGDSLNTGSGPPTVLDHDEGEYWPDDAQMAVQPLPGGGYVVAAFVGSAAHAYPKLTLYRCSIRGCRNPTTTRLDNTPISFIPGQVRALSLAVTSDQRPVVGVTDAETGLVELLSCDSVRCADPARTTLSPAKRVEAEYNSTKEAGVQVAMRSDDRPVVAYRDVSTGATVLAVCDDLTCRHPKTRRLTRPGWVNPAPSFALDSRDRPVFATYRLDDLSLLLVSCRDATCAHRDRVRLARITQGAGKLTVALDDKDRPIVVWADNRGQILDLVSGPVSLIHCVEPRCAG